MKMKIFSLFFWGYIIVENFAAFLVWTNLCNSVTGMSGSHFEDNLD